MFRRLSQPCAIHSDEFVLSRFDCVEISRINVPTLVNQQGVCLVILV